MTTPKSFRPVAAVVLIAGLFSVLPGCGGSNPQAKSDKKDDKKGNPTPNPNPNPNPNMNPTPDPTPKTPERIDTKSGVGKDAVDFLSAVGQEKAKASQLSTGFLKAIGLPLEL